MSTTTGLVSLLVLSYNSAEVLGDCLRAATTQRAADVEVLCLDNASGDDSAAIAGTFQDVQLIRSDSNVGYARGMNQLAAAARGEVVVFLNADCVLADDFAAVALAELRRQPEVSVLGAAVRRVDGSDDGAVLGVTDTMRVRMLGAPPPGATWPTFKPNGSCPVVRRSLLDLMAERYGISGFDPCFDTYGEDVDFAFRAMAVGAKTVCVAGLQATHSRSHASAVAVTDKRGRLRVNVVAGRHVNARRHLPRHRLAVVLPLLGLQDLLLVGRQVLRGDLRVVRDVVAAWRRTAALHSWRWRREHRTAASYSRSVTWPPRPPAG